MNKAVRAGFYLARRQIQRTSWWTTSLIIFIMMLTFLNMVVVGGILVGLVEGAGSGYRSHYTSDVIISALDKKSYIEQSSGLISALKSMPEVAQFSPRYIDVARVEAGYRERTRASDILDYTNGIVSGINPKLEDEVTHIGEYILDGRFLNESDTDNIVIGADLLNAYAPIDTPGEHTLRQAKLGDKVRLNIGEVVREVTIVGVVKTKSQEVDRRIFMRDVELRSISKRTDANVGEIAVKLKDGQSADSVVAQLKAMGFGSAAKIRTWFEARPKFIDDIKVTFDILGSIIGGIGLVVASITIFIVIFINAITRQKYIGILKGIGVPGSAIEISYICQSLFYAIIGSSLGLVILYVGLVPFFVSHPIDFPFSDGLLVAPWNSTAKRLAVLLVTTLAAGYIPAKMVIRRNTLDAILGR
jgi:putative ABC transport system permease protein